MRRLLHVGAGGNPLPEFLRPCDEVRLDINPAHKPDVVASMTDMGPIGGFSGVYCSHALEHLFAHEVEVALSEFHRVLDPGGVAIVVVPDLEDVRPTAEVVYESPAGPITGFDMYYGHRWWTRDDPHMAHHTGFVSATLEGALRDAGFARVEIRRTDGFNLLGVGVK